MLATMDALRSGARTRTEFSPDYFGASASRWNAMVAPAAFTQPADGSPTSFGPFQQVVAPGGAQAMLVDCGSSISTDATRLPAITFFDLVWCSALVSGSLATTNFGSPTLPSRDNNGANLGEGYSLIAVVGSASGTLSSSTYTVTYTNSAGTTGRTTTGLTWPGTIRQGVEANPFALATGDTGVRTIESVTVTGTANATGNCYIMVVRRIAVGRSAQLPRDRSTLSRMARLHSGTVLMPVHINYGSASSKIFHIFTEVVVG